MPIWLPACAAEPLPDGAVAHTETCKTESMVEPRTDDPPSGPDHGSAAVSLRVSRFRRLRFRWTLRTGSVAVACGIALLTGGTISAVTTYLAPAAPPAVCDLVRAEFNDILVPGHAAPVPDRMSGRYYRASMCTVESDDVRLYLELWHVGRGPAGGPLAQTEAVLGRYVAFNQPVTYVDIGDQAAYQVLSDDPVEVWIHARVGSYVLFGSYKGPDLTVDGAVGALESVAEEVLSRV